MAPAIKAGAELSSDQIQVDTGLDRI